MTFFLTGGIVDQFSIAMLAMLIFPVLFIYTMIRYIVLSIRHNDGRYIYTEMFYSMPFAALFFGGIFDTTVFIVVNIIFSIGLCVASHFQNAEFRKNEEVGATGSTYKLIGIQKTRFQKANETEKEEYRRMLSKRKQELGWRYEINLIIILLIAWVPPITVRGMMTLF